MSIEVVYTAESTATGGGRDGHVKSTDGRIDLDTRPPKEMGGSGEGVNPELLFSAGYAACFLGALRLVAKNEKVNLDEASGITARIGFGKVVGDGDSDGGFGLTAELIGYLPGLGQDVADGLMEKAHRVCPYSKATRGNIDVTLKAKVL
ncbi:organic hydroperoxide resistance protein [Mycolicibacterium iranicum]|uniref:Organic hydroperoxide resistance protein n=1 Tax=Mycolicibacterium iranicum TaxID=912594 RepID=A0A178LRQ6_MYCIR|nr:organic hydroperoxide resistance protein [Mycolicibacterium iranicum]OAN36387.1 organic hydroperoxide resistance protein [Mycolicibacterium iranicum]